MMCLLRRKHTLLRRKHASGRNVLPKQLRKLASGLKKAAELDDADDNGDYDDHDDDDNDHDYDHDHHDVRYGMNEPSDHGAVGEAGLADDERELVIRLLHSTSTNTIRE